MYYISSLSGGVPSAVATDRAIQLFGKNKVWPWFTDTNWEDPDLYRFLTDLENRWQRKIIRYKDGRTPLQVAEQKQIIPNQKIAPCTYELKIKPTQEWLYRVPKPVTVIMGLDWSETHRIDERRYWHRKAGRIKSPVGYAARIPGVYEWFPLAEPPYMSKSQMFAIVEGEWGIQIPELYRLGMDYNNCGGRCVKQSVGKWLLLREVLPDRFWEVANWETDQQQALGTDHAICRDQANGTVLPLALRDLTDRKAARRKPEHKYQDDIFSCMCSY